MQGCEDGAFDARLEAICCQGRQVDANSAALSGSDGLDRRGRGDEILFRYSVDRQEEGSGMCMAVFFDGVRNRCLPVNELAQWLSSQHDFSERIGTWLLNVERVAKELAEGADVSLGRIDSVFLVLGCGGEH